MPNMTTSERDAFLKEPGVLLHIGTVREDGTPLVTPIWFIYDGTSILFTPREKSAWYACMQRDPRVTLCIDEQPLPYRKVIIDGSVTVEHDLGNDAAWRDLYQRIASRYVPEEAAAAYVRNTIDQPRALLRVELGKSKVTTWRMPVEGEDVTGIWHTRYYAEGSDYARKSRDG